MHMHDEVSHVGIVDGALRLRLPGRVGGGVVRIDADDVELIDVLEGDVATFSSSPPKHEMEQLFLVSAMMIVPRVIAFFRVTRGVHP